jgi:ubiquitin-protein ligase E3 C
MFQTFSGSSRRPRQVNLSGQNINPFAASSWTPSASGTQKTVANAQQERLQRQHERERVNASKLIQKAWRGHKVRSDLAESRRVLFDESDVADTSNEGTVVWLAQKTRLLISFFNWRRRDDIGRLIVLSERISTFGYVPFLAHQDIERQVAPLSRVTLAALQG